VNFNLTKSANMQMCKYATNLTDVAQTWASYSALYRFGRLSGRDKRRHWRRNKSVIVPGPGRFHQSVFRHDLTGRAY